MDRFADLLSQLEAEYNHVLQEREQLRLDAMAMTAHRSSQSSECADSQAECATTAGAPGAQECSADDRRAGRQRVRVDLPSDWQKGTSGDEGKHHKSAWQCDQQTGKPIVPHSAEEPAKIILPPSAEEPAFGTSSRVSRAAPAHAAERAPYQSESRGSLPSLGGQTFASEAAGFRLLPRWLFDPHEGVGHVEFVKAMLAQSVGSVRSSQSADSADARPTRCLKLPMVPPGSKVRALWDLLSLVLLSVDIITIPMLAFLDDESRETVEPSTKQATRIAATLFWSLDIVASFRTGFYNGGVLQMEPTKVTRHYLKTWFPFDLSIVSLDWCTVILSGVMFKDVVGAARIAKMLRISRVMHAFRLLRTVKLPARVDSLSFWVRSEAISTYLGVAQCLLIIAVASHFTACAWYSVGGRLRPLSWVQVLDDEGRGLAYRYTTSLHWSVTQFTPASMEVVPRNTPERVLAIVVILKALVAFSCFVSSITQAMANLQRRQAERVTQDDNMRRYIAENGISLELGHRITRFAKAQHGTSRLRTHEEDVQIFKCLPPSLSLELHIEVFMPILCQHPLLQRSLKIDTTLMHEVCNEAMSETCLKPTEELFHPDQAASSAHFIQSGTWAYHHRRRHKRMGSRYTSASSKNALTEAAVARGGKQCVCEVALWLQWEIQGYFVAATTCEVVSLNANKFGNIAEHVPSILCTFREYAGIYCNWLEDHGSSCVIELGPEPKVVRGIVQETMALVGLASVTSDSIERKKVLTVPSLVSTSSWVTTLRSASPRAL